MSMGWMKAFNDALYHIKHKTYWTIEQARKELEVMPENVLDVEERDLILRLFKAEDDKEKATEALQYIISSYHDWCNSR
jgi:hypothetical protein